jgi:adenylate cyclase
MTDVTPLILIVDAEPIVVRTAEAVLVKFGYRVLTADSGAAAMEVCRQRGPITVLLTDAGLPDTYGLHLADSLRRSFNPDLRLVIMSGWDYSHLLERRLVTGMELFLAKPFDYRGLHDIVKCAVEGRPRSHVLDALHSHSIRPAHLKHQA